MTGLLGAEKKPPVGEDHVTVDTPATEPVNFPVGLFSQIEIGEPALTVGAGLKLTIAVSAVGGQIPPVVCKITPVKPPAISDADGV